MLKTLTNKGRRNAKKGFTLTELAIVIAVIAILIAVLVPTFTSIMTNARKSNAKSAANYVVTEYFSEFTKNPVDGSIIYSEDYDGYYVVYDSTADDLYTAYSTDETAYIEDDDGNSLISSTYLIFAGENGNVYYSGAATTIATLYKNNYSSLAVLVLETYLAAKEGNTISKSTVVQIQTSDGTTGAVQNQQLASVKLTAETTSATYVYYQVTAVPSDALSSDGSTTTTSSSILVSKIDTDDTKYASYEFTQDTEDTTTYCGVCKIGTYAAKSA
ncbi:MAG: prepilin-type N-terminal cleavage/methylation domain-containing protein [Clostridia bacterium]|nr:prepilin-type N-terminal cleavage/methylation domain-containing protein [Clostridia bacterium]